MPLSRTNRLQALTKHSVLRIPCTDLPRSFSHPVVEIGVAPEGFCSFFRVPCVRLSESGGQAAE